MLHQPLLCVCPKAACNESASSSSSTSSCGSIRKHQSCRHLCLTWPYLKGVLSNWICNTNILELEVCGAVSASFESRDIAHHRRLEDVSTPQCIDLTRSDITRMSQPLCMSLSLSFLSLSHTSSRCSVSMYSPLPCCTSPQLPLFCSSGLFSLSLSRPFPCLFPLPSLHL